jgi:hypothetical protein
VFFAKTAPVIGDVARVVARVVSAVCPLTRPNQLTIP